MALAARRRAGATYWTGKRTALASGFGRFRFHIHTHTLQHVVWALWHDGCHQTWQFCRGFRQRAACSSTRLSSSSPFDGSQWAFPSAPGTHRYRAGERRADASSSIAGSFPTSEIDGAREHRLAVILGGGQCKAPDTRLHVRPDPEFRSDGPRDGSAARRALAEGVEYEDFFLHFSEDTEIDPPNPEHASSTSLFGIPWVVRAAASAGHAGFWLYQSPPRSPTAASAGAAAGGALVVPI